VYKSIGVLLVKAGDREALKKELEEHQETLTRSGAGRGRGERQLVVRQRVVL